MNDTPNIPAAIPEKLVVFAHGKESGPWGTKITRLAETARGRGFEVMSPDYSHSPDPRARIRQLLELAPRAGSALVLVGSSMGAYVSAFAAPSLQPQGMFLMAPAFYFPGYDEEPPSPPPIRAVVHGWRDEIVPVDRAIRYARHHAAPLHLLDSDHGLNDRLPELAQLFEDLLDQATLLGAYRSARYGIELPEGVIELRAEVFDPAVDQALVGRFGLQQRWALVTACNPCSQRLKAAENDSRMAALRARLDADGICHVPGFGGDPLGKWPVEPSLLLIDPPTGYAESLARHWGQNAILVGRLGQQSEVSWLR